MEIAVGILYHLNYVFSFNCHGGLTFLICVKLLASTVKYDLLTDVGG